MPRNHETTHWYGRDGRPWDMRVRAKPKSYKEREYLACARKCITSCSSARGTCQSMHVACTNCMHGSGDDDEVAAAAAAIQHAIVEQKMLQLPKMFSAALQCDVAHLHKILLHCMRNQAACFAMRTCKRTCHGKLKLPLA